jgi:flagellar biosynthetic protein FliQ
MTPDTVLGFLYESMKIVILLSLPILLSGLIIGVIVGLFQAATQIHEMTLIFIFKLIAVGVSLLIFFPWIMRTLLDFTIATFNNMSSLVR